MSRRSSIVNTLVEKVKLLDGVTYSSNVATNVTDKLVFWDEINDYPYICIIPGDETREYLPAGFVWGFLDVFIKIYVKTEEPQDLLENIIEDLELLLDSNNTLEYDSGKFTTKISILNITTDQGLLNPWGVGEILIEVQYQVK